MAQRIREIMTSPPVTVQPQTPVVDVARRMREEDIGDVLVTEGDQLRGLVTDRDLVVRALAEGGDAGAKPVQEICSENLIAVSPDDDTDRAVQLMRERAMRRLPVVEENRPVGIVSLGDLALERDPDSALSDISAAQPNQ